ncbi:MAG TPA: SLC13 family permease, partial [Gemmatimonadaceae bacterium]
MILGVFVVVYVGMLLGGLPRLRLDRTGIALLGAIALLATGAISPDEAARAVDLPTLALLFGLMVISAQLRLGGFYTWVTQRLTSRDTSPARLLGAVVLGAGALSAVFSNDIICLAMTPVLIDVCQRRRLDPTPFLLALAAAANAGSAATLIGNPQNMLVGQRAALSFAGYLVVAGPIALASLAVIWAVLTWQHRGRWARDEPPRPDVAIAALPRFDRWQTTKGLAVAAVLMVLFLAGTLPREIVALGGAGALLCSRRLHSRDMLGLVDWQLLVLFIGLFVVNHALQMTAYPDAVVAALAERGVNVASAGWLFALTVALSNAISNVPAVMLLLPLAQGEPAAVLLAVASTLAGNLLL